MAVIRKWQEAFSNDRFGLKDAAAKAIYGSKAANGVVVIETRKPETGKLRISYKGDLNLTIPDLTGYNLCNAQEKFEVDKKHGVYSDPWFWEQYLNPNRSLGFLCVVRQREIL